MITITITGQTPLEALASLSAFGLHCLKDPAVRTAADKLLEDHTGDGAPAAPAAPAASSPVPAAPLPVEPSRTAPHMESPLPAAIVSEHVPTEAEVRKRGIEASRKYGKEAIVALLQQFNASGLSAIKETDRAVFLAELDKLDAGKAGEADA